MLSLLVVFSLAVHASISMGLDFTLGMDLAREIRHIFNRSVHPTDYSGHFIMVVSFARHSFRLDVDNVGLALESSIGGCCSQLKVSFLNDRVFSFNVSCKQVGFLSSINVALFAPNSNAIFISGAMVARIGRRSLDYGNWSASKSGLLLVHLNVVFVWALKPCSLAWPNPLSALLHLLIIRRSSFVLPRSSNTLLRRGIVITLRLPKYKQ